MNTLKILLQKKFKDDISKVLNDVFSLNPLRKKQVCVSQSD